MVLRSTQEYDAPEIVIRKSKLTGEFFGYNRDNGSCIAAEGVLRRGLLYGNFVIVAGPRDKNEVAERAGKIAAFTPTVLPTDRQARKNIPLYSGLIKYFPDALAAVAELSRTANDFHNPGQPLHWDRSKSSDDHDALCRHLWEAGTVDSSDGVRHSVKVAWRALAALQKEIENSRPSARSCGDDK